MMTVVVVVVGKEFLLDALAQKEVSVSLDQPLIPHLFEPDSCLVDCWLLGLTVDSVQLFYLSSLV